jgi:hypothetical protein
LIPTMGNSFEAQPSTPFRVRRCHLYRPAAEILGKTGPLLSGGVRR